MSHIYLLYPLTSKMRPINKKKNKKTGKPNIYPEANNEDLKFGIHKSGGIKTLESRYKYYIGDYNAKLIIEDTYEKLLIFEDRLKKVFSKYINNFKKKPHASYTQEWMSGITFEDAKKMILEEYENFNSSSQS
jgi:hypothetical protein